MMIAKREQNPKLNSEREWEEGGWQESTRKRIEEGVCVRGGVSVRGGFRSSNATGSIDNTFVSHFASSCITCVDYVNPSLTSVFFFRFVNPSSIERVYGPNHRCLASFIKNHCFPNLREYPCLNIFFFLISF